MGSALVHLNLCIRFHSQQLTLLPQHPSLERRVIIDLDAQLRFEFVLLDELLHFLHVPQTQHMIYAVEFLADFDGAFELLDGLRELILPELVLVEQVMALTLEYQCVL